MITGETQDFIDLVSIIVHFLLSLVVFYQYVLQNELIRLYVNHRPVIPLEKHLIQQAFSTISQR
jgi:hypothetical protein